MSDVYVRFVGPEGTPVFKTDLFEEAVGPHAPLARLPTGSFGMDGSLEIARAARERLERDGLSMRVLVGDLRRIPLRTGSVSRILSGSSLDHFPDPRDLDAGILELARVLASGGALHLTLDNPRNPIIQLRNRLPERVRGRTRIVPFFVGATYGPRILRERLRAAGLRIRVETALVHAPRYLAVLLARLVEGRCGSAPGRALARALRTTDALAGLPTRYLTGHYVAIHAEKPPSAEGARGGGRPQS